MSQVTVVDYGRGNLFSVRHALEACGADVTVTEDPAAIASADRLVLPGVGAFGDAAQELRNRGHFDAINEYFLADRPFLGICVGMQLLLEASEEFGVHPGFGLVAGHVVAIPPVAPNGNHKRVPHIGWFPVTPVDDGRPWEGTLLEGTAPMTPFYFVHSFTAEPVEAANRLADTDYDGLTISAAIAHGNVFATQFHPEKSGPEGLNVLRNFLSL
jgi:glutamine amidotransferase